MAEYSDIMKVAEARSFLHLWVINKKFVEKFYNFFIDIADYANDISYFEYDENEKSIIIYINRDDNFSVSSEKYMYDIVLSYMTLLNDQEIIYMSKNGNVIPPSIDTAITINTARHSAPHAMALYDVLFFANASPEYDIIKIKF